MTYLSRNSDVEVIQVTVVSVLLGTRGGQDQVTLVVVGRSFGCKVEVVLGHLIPVRNTLYGSFVLANDGAFASLRVRNL